MTNRNSKADPGTSASIEQNLMLSDVRLPTCDDLFITDIEGEVWVDIPEFEGVYMCSNLGRVKSLERQCLTRGGSQRTVSERILKQQKRRINKGGNFRAEVNIGTNNPKKGVRIVTDLIVLAFGLKKEDGEVFMHKDGNLLNNKLSNIVVGSKSRVQKLNNSLKSVSISDNGQGLPSGREFEKLKLNNR